MGKWLLLPLIALAAIPATDAATHPDRDHDGLPDRWERRHRLSTKAPSAKGDPDRDRLSNRREFRLRTNPRRADTDRDGLRDGAEVRRHRTNPRKADTDGDGVSDGVEVKLRTDPRRATSAPPRGTAPVVEGLGSAAPPVGGGAAAPPSGGASPTPPPVPSQFPSASNTGVPAGTTLTAYVGPSTITTASTVVDGKSIGCIRVTAPGVVIRNSKITCSDGGYAVLADDGAFTGTPLLIEDSEITCGDTPGSHAMGEARITARRVDISHCENGADINQEFIVEDSYIHDMYNSAASHTDGLQFAAHFENGQIVPGALNVTVRHNTIFGIGADGSFGTSAIITNVSSGGDTNILIDGNLLAGGAYTLYCPQTTGTNYRVTNNVFSRMFKSTVGYFGPSSGCSNETQSGNVYDNGQPASLG